MPVVLITPEELLHKTGPHTQILTEAGFEIVYPQNPTFTRGLRSEAETIEQLSVCDVVMAGGEWFTKPILDSLPRLRAIARFGVGFDRVDLKAATEHGTVVTITPNGNYEAVAEHAMALLLATAKSIALFDRKIRDKSWHRLITQPLRESTLGIVGLGRIGRALAVRAKAMRMNVIAYETQPDQNFVAAHGIELVDFEALLERSDYVSIHCPLNERTAGLFNKDVFAKMKRGSVLINTARGRLVVEADLIEALRSGHIRAAGLDVMEHEPPSPDNPLLTMENVVVTPHIGGEDTLSSLKMGIEAAECIVKLHRGDWPEGAVLNNELRGKWQW